MGLLERCREELQKKLRAREKKTRSMIAVEAPACQGASEQRREHHRRM
jgi:hypothetical protein